MNGRHSLLQQLAKRAEGCVRHGEIDAGGKARDIDYKARTLKLQGGVDLVFLQYQYRRELCSCFPGRPAPTGENRFLVCKATADCAMDREIWKRHWMRGGTEGAQKGAVVQN